MVVQIQAQVGLLPLVAGGVGAGVGGFLPAVSEPEGADRARAGGWLLACRRGSRTDGYAIKYLDLSGRLMVSFLPIVHLW